MNCVNFFEGNSFYKSLPTQIRFEKIQLKNALQVDKKVKQYHDVVRYLVKMWENSGMIWIETAYKGV